MNGYLFKVKGKLFASKWGKSLKRSVTDVGICSVTVEDLKGYHHTNKLWGEYNQKNDLVPDVLESIMISRPSPK
jgi:hypothetical protein